MAQIQKKPASRTDKHNADKAVPECEVMTLSPRDSLTFFTALTKPVKFNEALRKAYKSYKQNVVDE